MSSRSGNRTPGASVTGSNVTNYTNRDRALIGLRVGKIEAIDGIRTRDLSLTKRVLCQLSYDGISMVIVTVKIHLPGIEPGTSRV